MEEALDVATKLIGLGQGFQSKHTADTAASNPEYPTCAQQLSMELAVDVPVTSPAMTDPGRN